MSGCILFFADASSVHTRRWVGEMAARGFDCVVATRRPAELPGAGEVIALRPGGDGLGWIAALPQVRRLARQLRPRWLHGHYVTSYGLWAAAARAAVDAPLVLTAWGSDLLVTPREPTLRGRLMAALVRRNLRRAELVTADSADLLALARRHAPMVRCEELSWGADTDCFVPGTPAGGFEIVSARAWEPNYRIDLVLRAVAGLRALRPTLALRLHLLGGGPDEAMLRGLAAELGLAPLVQFTGRVDDPTMVATMQRARVALSLPRSDATSVSLLESMACGLPVLASDLPANRQWIDPAWCLPLGEDDAAAAAAVADKLAALADDPAAALAVGRRNRQTVLERASRRDQMDRMAALYRALPPAATRGPTDGR